MSQMEPPDECAALNDLIHDRGAQWSSYARAVKFDIEFRAVEAERKRVAKELHDEVLPLLARLIRSVQKHKVDATAALEESVDPHCLDIIERLHGTVAAFRDLLGELHAVDLEELGLVSALSNLCRRYARFTQRSIVFIEQGEECNLSEHQQLCLYRAIQLVLRMFSSSNNDVLILECRSLGERTLLTMKCVDKSVASSEWVQESQEFNTFESWCAMGGAEYGVCVVTGDKPDSFPSDLVISACDIPTSSNGSLALIGQISQERLRELDSIIATAQGEWSELINRDCELFKNLAVEMERKRIADAINLLILPYLRSIDQLIDGSSDCELRGAVTTQMKAIDEGVNSVIRELHPQLIDRVGLVASLRTLVARFRHATLIETTMISNLWWHQFETISPETKFALYRITQEALNNIEKHSDASRTLVTVTKMADSLVVCIEDNGRGMKASPQGGELHGKRGISRGLKIIEERATLIGATITVAPSTSFETGTLVAISMPCLGLVVDTQFMYEGIASR